MSTQSTNCDWCLIVTGMHWGSLLALIFFGAIALLLMAGACVCMCREQENRKLEQKAWEEFGVRRFKSSGGRK